MLLHDVLARRAREHGAAPAFTVGSGPPLTYGQWWNHSRAVHDAIRERGLRRGERVVLVFDDGDWASFVAAFVAVLAAGAIAVAVRHPIPARRLAERIRLVSAAGVVTGRGVRSEPDAGDAADAGPAAAPWTVAAGRPASGTLPPDAGWPAPVVPAPDAPASILFTSGTTGVPKAIVCPHADLAAPFDNRSRLPRQRFRALLTAVSVGTNAAQTVLRDCLLNGVHMVVLNPFEPASVASLVQAHHVTAISLVPSTARLAADALHRAGQALPMVRSVVCSSAPLDQPTVRRLAAVFPTAQIINVYTVAEGGTSLVGFCSPDRPPELGRLGPGMRVVGAGGEDVPLGQVGELWLEARERGRVYLGRPVASANRPGAEQGTRYVDGGRWIATGDLVRLEKNGTVTFVDRGDDVVVAGGFTISTTGVEAVVRDHPGVRDVAVFGVAHPALGRMLAAAVVLDPGVPVDDVRDHCRRELPAEQVPADILSLDELPATANGKVRREELARRYLAGAVQPPADGVAEPAGATATLVVDAVRAAVAGATVDLDSNFFRLGGHSLAAMQVAYHLTQRSGVDVPTDLVLRHPVVRDLAVALDRLRVDAD